MKQMKKRIGYTAPALLTFLLAAIVAKAQSKGTNPESRLKELGIPSSNLLHLSLIM